MTPQDYRAACDLKHLMSVREDLHAEIVHDATIRAVLDAALDALETATAGHPALMARMGAWLAERQAFEAECEAIRARHEAEARAKRKAQRAARKGA